MEDEFSLDDIEFDAEKEAEENDSGFPTLPAGIYVGTLEESEVRKDDESGKIGVKARFAVLDESTGNNVSVFHYFNLRNPSEVAQRIGKKEFADLCLACGISKPKSTIDLHGIPVQMKVAVENNPTFGKQNRIKKFSAVASTKTGAAKKVEAAAAGGDPWG